jgi:hypothetical protein
MERHRQRARELMGWTILSMVVNLSRLAVWVDGVLGKESEAATDDSQ